MNYVRFCPRFWIDEKVLSLSEDAKILLFYILTCPHRTVEGLFRLPKPYICADLEWSMERLAEPFAELLRQGFIRYDETVGVILIINALKYQYPENPNQIKSALAKLAELPETPLLKELQGLAEGLAEGFGKPPTPTPTPTPTPETPLSEEEAAKGKVFDESSQEYRIASLLRSLILANRPSAKVPLGTAEGLQGWCRDIDLLLRLDGRDPAEVETVIRWCQADSFWMTNILSPSSLRKNFDKLAMKMKVGGNGGDSQNPNRTPSRTNKGSRGR